MTDLISEQFRICAEKWVDADSAANILEETKSSVLAKMVSDLGDIPVTRAEVRVKSSQEWRDFITKMVEARRVALSLKMQLEYIRMTFHEWQSKEASRRAEMRL